MVTVGHGYQGRALEAVPAGISRLRHRTTASAARLIGRRIAGYMPMHRGAPGM
jgi:hypothetical protein